jgi:hydrogenase maturation factor HypF (carbamoyltransferase family)
MMAICDKCHRYRRMVPFVFKLCGRCSPRQTIVRRPQ